MRFFSILFLLSIFSSGCCYNKEVTAGLNASIYRIEQFMILDPDIEQHKEFLESHLRFLRAMHRLQTRQ